MRCLYIVLFLLLSVIAEGQQLHPQLKTALELYFAQRITNSINGAYIMINSVAPDRISNTSLTEVTSFSGMVTGRYDNLTVPWIKDWAGAITNINNATSTWTQSYIDSTSATNWISTNSLWKSSSYIPSADTSPAHDRTLSASNGYLYLCVSNNWAGTGTNWQRATLTGF